MTTKAAKTEHAITVLLVDDQPMIGEVVRRMLAGEPNVVFHYCKDASKAVETALQVQPTVILQDLVMPEVDGLDLVVRYRQEAGLQEVPLIVLSVKEEAQVKAEAFARGANDYLVKLPDKLELVARIRYHSQGYIHRLQRNEAYEALEESRRILSEEVEKAARYVESLLPPKWTSGPVRTQWEFIPSTELGGDTFGYHWLDPEHLACFLVDVCGHGVGAALLSVSVLNAIRSGSLPQTDFRHPGQVLESLNRAFPMEQQHGMFFTAWYGVYNPVKRELVYSGGGHPPGLVWSASDTSRSAPLLQLESDGPMIGAMAKMDFATFTCQLPERAELLLYSDGAFEIEYPDGEMWSFPEFVEFLQQPLPPGETEIPRLLNHIRNLRGPRQFNDDVSVVLFELYPQS